MYWISTTSFQLLLLLPCRLRVWLVMRVPCIQFSRSNLIHSTVLETQDLETGDLNTRLPNSSSPSLTRSTVGIRSRMNNTAVTVRTDDALPTGHLLLVEAFNLKNPYAINVGFGFRSSSNSQSALSDPVDRDHLAPPPRIRMATHGFPPWDLPS